MYTVKEINVASFVAVAEHLTGFGNINLKRKRLNEQRLRHRSCPE